MDSLAGGIFNLLGITGSGIATSDLTPPVFGPVAREQELSDFTAATKISDPNVWSYYNTALHRPSTFDEMLRLWNDMSTWDMVTAALKEVVEEATQPDPNTDAVLWYECSDKELEDDLNTGMLVDIDAETVLPSQLWHIAALGNSFDKIHYERGKGVVGLAFAHPMDVRRYWLEKTRRCIGFRWLRGVPDTDNLYVQGNSKIEAPTLNYGGVGNVENLWYPWDFLHLRRMFRMRINEHGEPIFDEAQGIYKKLRMAIDQMTVHRAQVQPDRYVVNIDVQTQPPAEQVRTVQRWRQALRSKLAFGEGSGTDQLGTPTDLRSYYNAWSLDTILWMAKPQGFQHAIEKLGGTQNVPDVYDIEILMNIFYSIIGMPKSWVGIGPAGDNSPMSGRALLAQDMRFLRTIRAIRKPVTLGYTWLGYLHAILKGKDVSDLEIKAKMSYISTLEDELRMDVLDKQIDILTKMAGMLKEYGLDKDAWIDLVLRKYMHMPDDVVDALRVALPPEVEPATAEGVNHPPKHRRNGRNHLVESRLRMNRAFDEMRNWVESRYGKSIVEDMQRWLNGDRPILRKRSIREMRRFQVLPPRDEASVSNYLTEAATQIRSGGLVVSAYDQIENATPRVSRGEDAPNEPAYRRFIGK